MGKWRGISSSYVRAPMDELSSAAMSPGGSLAEGTKQAAAVLVKDKDPVGGDTVATDLWAQRLHPSNLPTVTGGDYRLYCNNEHENGDMPVCNGNGRANSATDDIHDSTTLALTGAMHGGRVFATSLDRDDEDDEEETMARCCETNGGGKTGAGELDRVSSCDLEDDSMGDLSDNEDLECGLGPCAPRWMQVFASKQVFLVVFCITWVLQGMYYTYFVSVITTIEKLFQIQSKTTGIIMSVTEIGQVGSSLLLTYYGGHGHRPKWIAWGMVLFALSSFTCSLPHFIFGEQLLQANGLLPSAPLSDSRVGGSSLSNFSEIGEGSKDEMRNLCLVEENVLNAVTSPPWSNFSGGKGDKDSCTESDGREGTRIHGRMTTIFLAILFVSLLGVGMSQTAVYTLGIPYIDDNVNSGESPLYFAITIGVRILGPSLGFILGSLCTRLYVDLSKDPQILPKDTRWVGAWWLGLVLIPTLLIPASAAMFMFPKRLPGRRKTGRRTRRSVSATSTSAVTVASPVTTTPPTAITPLQPPTTKEVALATPPPTQPRRDKKKNPSLRDFPKAVKRLLKNDILIFRTISSVLHILPISGLYTFLPKYLESQFRLPTHTANMISGVGGILVMGLGIIISGVFILRVKPNARWVAAWIAFTAVGYAFGMGVLMLIGCPMDDFAGFSTNRSVEAVNTFSFEPACKLQCECDQKFSPICGRDGRTYYSACHAGCRNVTIVGGVSMYSDCDCVGSDGEFAISSAFESGFESPGTLLNATMQTATWDYCPLQCGNFVWYMLLFSLFVFFHSTSEVGSMLLILRCVDPRDKAMALGIIQFAIGLFGNVPCTIIYGAVVDSACLVWDMACGVQGACKLYDADSFRRFYHGLTGGILLCAFFVDLIVWYKAGSINFVEEPGGTSDACQEEELSPIAVNQPLSETTV